MKPSIGRIVHFQFDGLAHAALVIGINEDETVDLQVFYRDGETEHVTNIPQGDVSETWNWPPRA